MANVTKKPNGKWRIRYRDVHRKERYETFRTKREAEDALADRLIRVKDGTHQRFDIPFDQLVAEFRSSRLAHGLRESTIRDYEEALARLEAFFGRREVRGITAADAEEFRNNEVLKVRAARLERLEKRLPNSPDLQERESELRADIERGGIRSTNKALRVLRMLLDLAEQRGYVTRNVAKYAKPLSKDSGPKLDEDVILRPTEIVRLLDSANEDDRPALMTVIYCGLRVGELFGLQWRDIDWSSRRLRVQRQLNSVTDTLAEPKSVAARRYVDLPAELVSELKRWKLRCPTGELDLVFPNERGGLWHTSNWRNRVWHPTLRRAGLRRIRIHDARHTFASLLISSGADVVTVARRLGHANPSVTLDVYSHLFERRQESESLGDRLASFVQQEAAAGR
jgi:integrase